MSTIDATIIRSKIKDESTCVLVVEYRAGRRPVRVLPIGVHGLNWVCADGRIESLNIPEIMACQVIAQRLNEGILVFDSFDMESSPDPLQQAPLAFFS